MRNVVSESAASLTLTKAPSGTAPTGVERGKRAFVSREQGHCVLCHSVPGVAVAGNVGPALAGVGSRLTADEIRYRIEEMPVWPTTKLVSWAASTITGSPIVIGIFPVLKGVASHAVWEWLWEPLSRLVRFVGL